VVQRTRELGIRTALGATSKNIVGLILRNGMKLTCIGLVIGVGGALGLSQFLASMLFNVGKYLKPDLLIIEDFAGKQLPKHSGEYLLEVVMRRYENRSMLITSNRPLEEWGKLFQDVPVASAILDRLLHHSRIVTFAGRSYRTKDLDLGGDAAEPRS